MGLREENGEILRRSGYTMSLQMWDQGLKSSVEAAEVLGGRAERNKESYYKVMR